MAAPGGETVRVIIEAGPGQAKAVAELARVDTRTKADPGDELTLDFDLSLMHAFDPETTQRIF